MMGDDLHRKFARLTPAQHQMMVFQGDDPGFNIKTGRKLVELGLAVEDTYKPHPLVTTVRFTVPIPIHMAYCEWCEARERAK